jgi:RNA polymerase subunit RPABC4/transcription elongation factor Spt4
MTIDQQVLNNIITGLVTWGAAFLVALWLSLIFWTYRDIRLRARDPFLRILSIIVVALLFLPGVVIYLILRPAYTLEDEYQHTLEEEALLQSIEDVPVCPGCGRRIQPAWMVCPNCHTRLKKPCHQCHNLMELSWNLCPYCGTPAPGMRRENPTLDDVIRSAPAQEDALAVEQSLIEEQLNKNGAP